MGKKKRDTPTIGSAGQDGELGATYFPFLGPSPFDTQDTSFCGPGRPTYQASSSGLGTGHRMGTNRRDAESIHSSPSDIPEDNVISVPMGPRTFREPQSLVLVAPPYSPFFPPGFAPLAPSMSAPIMRSPLHESYDTFAKRRASPYQHMQHMGLKHVTIFMAGLFLLAFVAVIFTAVYFGQRLDSDSKA
ncbi:hypothetical protein ElyMa_000636300 [Elysia marginata]|uniref:Uncharacterized protein n=1 Tax=Elysia marginata TaxID=1093978 RepID=A0AAV4GB06_9GAST|nr:hypothetical protein ElyMa_000636300 [Elysia marginata]